MNINPKYQNGKIYTIRCRYDDNLIYVGSTIQKLCMRMAGHRRDETCSLYQYVKGDFKNWYIELYEDYPCDNKNILEKREGEIIRLIGTINKSIAGRTRKEYNKEHYQANRDKILEKNKEKTTCDKCKSIVRRCDISTHKKTKKCLNYNVANN